MHPDRHAASEAIFCPDLIHLKDGAAIVLFDDACAISSIRQRRMTTAARE